MPLPDTMSKSEAEQIIRELAELCWPIVNAWHADLRCEERGVTARDVQRTLRHGSLLADPVFDQAHRNWTVNVHADLEDFQLRVGVAIDWDPAKKSMILRAMTVIPSDYED